MPVNAGIVLMRQVGWEMMGMDEMDMVLGCTTEKLPNSDSFGDTAIRARSALEDCIYPALPSHF